MDNNYDSPEYFIQIEDYLDGLLPAAEAARFEAQLRNDEALAAAVDKQRATRAGVKAFGLRSDIAAMHQRMMQEVQPAPAVVRKLSPVRILARVAAAAVLLVALAGVYEYTTVSAGKLYTQKEQMYEARVDRGTADPVVSAYLAGDMAAVISRYRTIAAPTAADHLLAGNAWLQQGDAQQAAVAFKAVQQTENPYVKDAEYYEAMALLKQNKIADALPVFEKIRADRQHPYHHRVGQFFIWRLQLLRLKTGG